MGEVATLNLKPTIIGLFRSRQLIPPCPLELTLGGEPSVDKMMILVMMIMTVVVAC